MEKQILPVVSLAPMAGITDWPMRVLCYRMGAQYACSEMVSAIGLMCAKPGNDVYRRLLAVHPEEKGTACQLFGKDPVLMAEAAQRVTELNRFASLDINMGCPARKVVSSGEGSALLLNPDLAFRVMEAVKTHTRLPVTVKTRLGYDDASMNALLLGQAAQQLGLSWICIHGRTRQQQYSGTADYEAIARIREKLTIPVIANGDVTSPESARRILAQTGAAGLMIGRAAMGNPWLFRAVRQDMAGQPLTAVTLTERIDTALLQAQWMVDYKGERLGIMEMRKHVGHYIGGVRGATAIRRELNLTTTLDQMRRLLNQLRAAGEEQTL